MNSRAKSLLRITAVALLVLGFSVYGMFRSKNFLSGPKIILTSPANGLSCSNSYVEVEGVAVNIANLFINGRQIFTDDGGNFKEGLLLAQGNNTIIINAKDKFGREAQETREVLIKN